MTVSFLEAYAGVPTFPVSKISTFPVVKTGNPNENHKIVFADVDINIATEPDDAIDLTDSQIQTEIDRLGVTVHDDVELNLSMNVWVIELADGSTPADYTDDRYTISGGGQYVCVISNHSTSSVNVMQLALANVLVSNECSLNPVDGHAVINELDVSTGSHGSLPIIATALIELDGECNGEAQVILATGNYIASNGASITLTEN